MEFVVKKLEAFGGTEMVLFLVSGCRNDVDALLN